MIVVIFSVLIFLVIVLSLRVMVLQDKLKCIEYKLKENSGHKGAGDVIDKLNRVYELTTSKKLDAVYVPYFVQDEFINESKDMNMKQHESMGGIKIKSSPDNKVTFLEKN